jgi:hypothetical protein
LLEQLFADPTFHEACQAHRERRFDEALERYQAVLAARPDSAFTKFCYYIAQALQPDGNAKLHAIAEAVDAIGDDLERYLSVPFVSFLRWPSMLRRLGQALVDFGAASAGRRLLAAAVKCQATSGFTLEKSAQAFDGSFWTVLAKEGLLGEAFDTSSSVQPQSADDWYRIGAQYFRVKDFSKACRAFKAMAAYDARTASIFRPSAIVGDASPELRPDQRNAIAALLDQYAEADAMGMLPAPIHSRRLGNAPVSPVPFDEINMLTVFTRWVNCTPNSLPGYLAELFHGTATRVGIRSHFFAGDPVIYNGAGSYKPAEMRACLDKLADTYRSIMPDIFLFDASYPPGSDTIDHEFLCKVIDRKRTKVVAVVGDAWWGFSAHWEEIVDLIVTFDPLVTNDALLKSPYPERVLPIFHPIDELRFTDLPPGADIDPHALFVGSVTNTPAMMRMPWIAALADSKAPMAIHDGDRQATQALSHEAYALAMRKAAMTYSLSSRNRNRSTIIGRQWEAIQSGTLLLEEGGSPLNEFFMPFRHYVPFENLSEAVAFTHYFLEDRAARDDIASRATKFRRRYYNTRRFWELVISSALCPTPDILRKSA